MTRNAQSPAPREAAIAAVAMATIVSSSEPETADAAGAGAAADGAVAAAAGAAAGAAFDLESATALKTYRIAIMMINTRNTTSNPMPATFSPYTRRSVSDALFGRFSNPLENAPACPLCTASASAEALPRATSRTANNNADRRHSSRLLFVPESLRLKLIHPLFLDVGTRSNQIPPFYIVTCIL